MSGMEKRELAGKVQTVLGIIEPDELGLTLPHEHFLIDTSVWHQPLTTAAERQLGHQPVTLDNLGWVRHNGFKSLDNLVLDDETLAVKEALLFKAEGGKTVIDVTMDNCKRAPQALVRISRATGLNIIMGSGYYVGEAQGPDFDRKSGEEIAEEIIRDILVGVRNTEIRSGIIGEIGCSWPLTDREKKSLQAAVYAQRATGAAITVHTGRDARSPLEIARFFEDAGADMSRVALGHLDREAYPMKNLQEIARTGCFIEFDQLGQPLYYAMDMGGGQKDRPSDFQVIRQIIELIAKGYLNQILLSQDVCEKIHLAAYGHAGYAHILRNMVPHMRSRGISEEEIRTIMVDNPKRLARFA